MTHDIGVLYESDEWSDHKLALELHHELLNVFGGGEAVLINMEDSDAIERALACDLLVSRVFASAAFRRHVASLDRMSELIEAAQEKGVPLINPGRAHTFEISKRASTEALMSAGIKTPSVQACAYPDKLDPDAFAYPCIIKPDCGGRTTHTLCAQTPYEARQFLKQAPDIVFLVEDFIQPEYGYITRAEIINGTPALIVKRSVGADGLSAYHLGSTYALYPECSAELRRVIEAAAQTLDFQFGSFDIIETAQGAYFIDANSVSNVSEDCTEMFGMDLMAEYAKAIVGHMAGKEDMHAVHQRGI